MLRLCVSGMKCPTHRGEGRELRRGRASTNRSTADTADRAAEQLNKAVSTPLLPWQCRLKGVNLMPFLGLTRAAASTAAS